MIALILISTILVALSILYYVSRRKFDFWEKRGVPYEKPTLLFGNFADYILMRRHQGRVMQALCEKHAGEPYFGVFYGTEPALVVQDPALVRLVTTKDFLRYSSREVAAYTHLETTTQNLFFTHGDRWKVLRQNLTSLFSSAKMKNMFHLIEKCCDAFDKMLDEETKTSNEVDIRTTMVRYGMDCVTSCAFGVNSNVMGADSSNNPFKIIGDLIFETSTYRGFKIAARAIWPYIFYGLGFQMFPAEIDTFFNKLVSEVFQERNNKPSTRQDFVDLLITLKEKKFMIGDAMTVDAESKKKIRLEVTDELLIAQCVTFFGAGFETSASTMSFTLFELAKHEAAQERVHEEIDAYLQRTGGRVTYECLTELPYLEACVDEALRLYPVLGVVTREVVAPASLAGLQLPRGLRVHLPVYHLHRNAAFFPDPDQFRPERFLAENKKNIAPYTYMPFGEGPRICIGMRFAKMQMMAGLVTLLRRWRLRLAAGAPRHVDFKPRTFVTQATTPLRLVLTPRAQKQIK